MQIEKVAPSERVTGRWLVWLDNGKLLRVSEKEVISFSLCTGMELSEAVYGELTQAAQKSAIQKKALEMLLRRPMSRRELIRKLTQPARRRNSTEQEKGQEKRKENGPPATEAQAEEVADWLEEFGYLNDAEYAKTLVRHFANKGYGIRKIRDELFRRGVPREDWDTALAELETLEESGKIANGVDAFLEKRLKGRIPDAQEWKRLSRALARRGFGWEEIQEGLRRYGAELEE